MFEIVEDTSTRRIVKDKDTGKTMPALSEEFKKFLKIGGIPIGQSVTTQGYKELRTKKYPDLETQMDLLYHDKKNGTTTWEDAITAVKEEFPITLVPVTTLKKVPAWVEEIRTRVLTIGPNRSK